jgi:hypothetical protein
LSWTRVLGNVALRPAADVVASRLDLQTVLVHIPTNRIFELNETGTRVWELLGQGLEPDAILSHLVDEYEVQEDRAAAELDDLLHRLRSAGLLVL